jgi:hypothetical protein
VNIYEKLQAVRVELAKQGIKKGKKNTYAGYSYYELADFLPQIQELCQKHKIAPLFTVSNDGTSALLFIQDMEKQDARLEFSIPMSQAQLKACHPVQNLGAVLTYERRYLYMIAFELVEADVLEATTGDPRQALQQVTPGGQPVQTFAVNTDADSKAELERLWAFVGWDVGGIEDYMNNYAERNKQPVNSLLYEKVLNEQVTYLKSEAEKGNPQYAGMTFDDGMPF